MHEKEYVIEVDNPQIAADAVRLFDSFSTDLIVGLGVIARGYLGDREKIYVFVNLEDATEDDIQQIISALGTFGKTVQITIEALLTGKPRPHFMASGLSEKILTAMRAYYPNCDIGPQNSN